MGREEKREIFTLPICLLGPNWPAYDTQRDAFLGAYRSWDSPRGRWSAAGRSTPVAYGWAPMGSHHVKLNLKPGRNQGGHLPAGLP